MSNCIVSGSVVSSYGLLQQLQGSQRRGGLMALLAHVHVGLASPSKMLQPWGSGSRFHLSWNHSVRLSKRN